VRTTSLLISAPGSAQRDRGLVAYRTASFTGDFGNFRAPQTTVPRLCLTRKLRAEIPKSTTSVTNDPRTQPSLDHGTTVPLYFLQHNVWHGRVRGTRLLSLPTMPSRSGRAVKTASGIDRAKPVAFIGRGRSQAQPRLQSGSPAGLYPRHTFSTNNLSRAVRQTRHCESLNVDHDLRKLAGDALPVPLARRLRATQDSPSSC